MLCIDLKPGNKLGKIEWIYVHGTVRGTPLDEGSRAGYRHLLIGDLFTDRVDKVWGPMESLYEPGKMPPDRWDAPAAPEVTANKANELVLPAGLRT